MKSNELRASRVIGRRKGAKEQRKQVRLRIDWISTAQRAKSRHAMGIVSNNDDMTEENSTAADLSFSSPLPVDGTKANTSPGRIGSILFSADAGPASSLITTRSNDDSENTVEEDETETASPPVSPEVRVRAVKFAGIGDSPFHSNAETPVSSREQLKKMREKLTQMQINYQAERAQRKRKEKSLVKLAKQLNKRGVESEFKDEKIAKVRADVDAVAELLLSNVSPQPLF
jgi:hypothetical protein